MGLPLTGTPLRLPWAGVVLRRIVILSLLAGSFAAPAGAASTLLMPGVTYTRQMQFTPHGPVAIHVLTAPRPGGLWALRPVLSDGALVGRQRVTEMQRDVSPTATVAGVNGDLFAPRDGTPTGVLIQGGVLKRPPHSRRSSIGLDASGRLQVRRIGYAGVWQGLGQRRPLSGLNQPPGPNGIALFTPGWGPRTPALPDAVEAVVASFPAVTPGVELAGTVTQMTRGGNTPIPAGGAVFVARGTSAGRLAAEALVNTRIAARFVLRPDWGQMVEALGGGPVIVRNGRPVFRAFEDFAPEQISFRDARTAVGQRRDGKIVLVVVDGRRPGYSVGVSNYELALILFRLGVVTGSALDSGGSSTMAFEGELLNRPADRSGERRVSQALLVHYFGVHAPPAAEPVLSPNGDGVAERQVVTYKVVRPSRVTARIVGPDRVARVTQEGERTPGVYRVTWPGTTASGAPEPQGRWRWLVTAVDDRGQASSVERGFWLNNTLGFLQARPVIVVRAKRARRVPVATFRLAQEARVTVTVESVSGAIVKTLVRTRLAAGTRTLRWNGRNGKNAPVYAGRYIVRVRVSNRFGPAALTAAFSVRR